MRKIFRGTALAVLVLTASLPAMAQYLVVSLEQVRDIMTGAKKAVLVDVRMPEEYQAGHIPGAINIPAENILKEKGRLPKDKSTAIIFYCRGIG